MRYINSPRGRQPQRPLTALRSAQAAVLLALASHSPLTLAESQFYLLAKPAPVASLVGTTSSAQAVYLRWGLVEGELPADINRFRLYRNGSAIGEYPATGTLSSAEIAQLYQGPQQQRRLMERVSTLKEEAARDDSVADFAVNQFAERIHERLNSSDDRFWSAFTATQDFNIAVARYRAAYDYQCSGICAYELKAVSVNGAEQRLGYAEVDTTQSTSVLANQNFTQVLQSACDEPDFRDHYTVALNWDGPQTGSQADELAHRLFVAGYDLYRSRDNLAATATSAPIRDLRNEAASASIDSKGQVQFSGLERVNDVLVLSQPDNSPEAEWLETREDLLRAGLKPGDTRAYYLVARDFTGQFGPTQATLVTVPDMARPPAPWDINVFLDESTQQAELSFTAIDLNSYFARHADSRNLCINDAASSGIVEFVPPGENCATFPTTRVHTKIKAYLLYRFADFDTAKTFSDSDADGFADRTERLSGSQCVAASSPNTATLIATIPPTADALGRIRVNDAVPASNKGQVYWYRVAALSEGGNLSLLSEPVRVNFPDRSLPEKPGVSMTRPQGKVCDCRVSYSTADTPFAIAVDGALDASSIGASCQGIDLPLTEKDLLGSAVGSACTYFNTVCNDSFPSFSLDIDGSQGQCQVAPTGGNNFCFSGTMTIEPVYCDEPVAFAGGISDAPVSITITPPAGSCATLYQRIGNVSTRVGSSCGSADPVLDYVHEQGEFCGYAVAQDGNNNISPVSPIPCSVISDSNAPTPIAPRMNELLLGSDEATLHWYAPQQPQVVNEVEFERRAPAGLPPMRHSVSTHAGGDQQATMPLPAQTSATEQWCARVRTHAISTDISRPKVSEWSAPLCVTRSTSVPPAWLPWPVAETVAQGATLDVFDNNMAAAPIRSPLDIGLHIPLTYIYLPDEKSCQRSMTRSGVETDYNGNDGETWLHLECANSALPALKADINSALNLMVFRQARRPDGAVSELIQVSPLLQTAYWNPTLPDGTANSGKAWLNDPYIWLWADINANNGNSSINATVAFVDRAGLVNGWEYRYQIVWFDRRHALREWRMSDWTLVTGAAQ